MSATEACRGTEGFVIPEDTNRHPEPSYSGGGGGDSYDDDDGGDDGGGDD